MSSVGSGGIPLSGKNFLSISSITPVELRHLLDEAHSLKSMFKANPTPFADPPMKGKSMAMIFEKRSTRTRVSTETGFVKLGGHPLFLSSQDIQLNVNESLYDTSNVLTRFNDIILARVNSNDTIETLGKEVRESVLLR